jgi:hypothetical protein
MDGAQSIRRVTEAARLVRLSRERSACRRRSAGEAFVQNVLNHLPAFDDGITARRGAVSRAYRVAAF